MTDNDLQIYIESATNIIGVILAGLILPILLIPIVRFTGYSEIVEEIAKALVIFFIVLRLRSTSAKLWTAILFGFLFGLSENMFYLTNVFALGKMIIFWQRFIMAVPMHIATVLIITLSAISHRKLILAGFLAAVIVHVLFNLILLSGLR